MRNPNLATHFILLSALLGGATVQAADQALLIGVGDYQSLEPPLPGIPLDIITMRETAYLLGFDKITELQGKQATLKGIRQTLKQFASQVGPNDRVLIYFSGHGSSVPDQNSDEEDNQDEAWLTYDTQLRDDENGQHLETLLLDDEVEDLLKQIPSKNILVALDACHSGTATKGLSLNPSGVLGEADIQPKVFKYKGMWATKGAIQKKAAANENVATFSAAADDEESVATSKGSIFTLGLGHTIKSLAKAGRNSVSLGELRDSVSQYISASGNNSFHPQVSSTNKIIQIRPIKPVTTPDNHLATSQWQAISALAKQLPPLKVKANKQKHVINQDSLELDMNLPFDGYLNIVSIDSADKTTILFPNEAHRDNYVKAGDFHFPSEEMTFDLPAIDQPGPVLTFVFLTREPLDSYVSGTGFLDTKGGVDHKFREFSAKAMESIKALVIRRSSSDNQGANEEQYAGIVKTQVIRK